MTTAKKLQEIEKIARKSSLTGGMPFIKDTDEFSVMTVSALQFKASLNSDGTGYLYLWKIGNNNPFKYEVLMPIERFDKAYKMFCSARIEYLETLREDGTDGEDW